MQTVKIIAVGKLKEKYLRDAADEYIKRLGAYCKPEIIELKETFIPENPSEKEIIAALSDEGKAILKAIDGRPFTALCIEGKELSSEDLSGRLEKSAAGGLSEQIFVIGSSHGLSDEVKSKADFKLSMSKMTFPHQLARVMLLEQIYRAFSIAKGGKYHK